MRSSPRGIANQPSQGRPSRRRSTASQGPPHWIKPRSGTPWPWSRAQYAAAGPVAAAAAGISNKQGWRQAPRASAQLPLSPRKAPGSGARGQSQGPGSWARAASRPWGSAQAGSPPARPESEDFREDWAWPSARASPQPAAPTSRAPSASPRPLGSQRRGGNSPPSRAAKGSPTAAGTPPGATTTQPRARPGGPTRPPEGWLRSPNPAGPCAPERRSEPARRPGPDRPWAPEATCELVWKSAAMATLDSALDSAMDCN